MFSIPVVCICINKQNKPICTYSLQEDRYKYTQTHSHRQTQWQFFFSSENFDDIKYCSFKTKTLNSVWKRVDENFESRVTDYIQIFLYE